MFSKCRRGSHRILLSVLDKPWDKRLRGGGLSRRGDLIAYRFLSLLSALALLLLFICNPYNA